MTTRTPTINYDPNGQRGVVLAVWTGLANGDDGARIEVPSWPDLSIQFTGTFGAGGTILFEGSNAGAAYYTLTDPQGNAISKTAAGTEQIEEVTRYVRPRVTGGDGSTLLTATLIAKRLGR